LHTINNDTDLEEGDTKGYSTNHCHVVLHEVSHYRVTTLEVKHQNEILLGSQGTVNQTTSRQHTLFKKLVQHTGEERSC